MRSCLRAEDRARLRERLLRLPPDARPRWGALDAGAMLCHLVDSLRIAYGEQEPGTPERPVPAFFRTRLGRWLVIDSPLPWPKGRLRSPVEWFATPRSDFEADRQLLLAEMDRFDEPRERRGCSPAVGPLDAAQWGRLCWRHCDHHLKQFGC